MAYSDIFAKANLKVTHAGVKTVVFTVGEGALLKQLASILSRETMRLTNDSKHRSIGEDLMRKYLLSLLEMRVSRIVGRSLPNYRSGYYNYAVPSLFNTALSQIGSAFDRAKGISFALTSEKAGPMLKAEEMTEVSNILKSLERDGFKMVEGLPKSTEGNVDVLSVQDVEGELLSYKDGDIVAGFWASIVKVEWLKEGSTYVSDLQCSYGVVSEYADFIQTLIATNE